MSGILCPLYSERNGFPLKKGFYLKLAASNIRKNRKTYLPYLLTCIGMVAMYYMICSLSLNQGLEEVVGSDVVRYTLSLGAWVTAIFAAIFLFYTNSFLMKRRKKEFGLYNILGMEKKHLCRVIFWETVFILLLSLVIGLAAGLLLDKLMFLALLRLFECEVPLGFSPSSQALVMSCLLFGGIFLLIFINSLRQIHLAKPIELLKGGEVGEREPKTKWALALVGVLCLGGGYYIALSTTNPVAAIAVFFVAVLLVIAGTYCLFTAGSIALLKLLRKKKSYYYRTRHFISLSGMIYRMKQNAVGLANICILSTAVLVMISSTFSMYIGMEDIIDTRYPRSILITCLDYSEQGRDSVHRTTDSLLAEQSLTPTNTMEYTYLCFSALEQGDSFITGQDNTSVLLIDNVVNLFFLTLEDYNRSSGRQLTLEEDEVLLYSNRTDYDYSHMKVMGMDFTVKEKLEDFVGNGIMEANIASSHFIVVKDLSVIEALDREQKEVYGKNASVIRSYYGFDLDADRSQIVAFYESLSDEMKQNGIVSSIECREESRNSFLSLYGGLFFIGVFLGLLFIMATILIIYYKQVSEGYDDRERYHILQKVGMSRMEIRQSIHSQILTVFFLPLVTAGIHMAFAFPAITRILAVLSLNNVQLFALCTVGCFLLFGLLYALVYAVTAKAYYRIVS